MPELPPDRPKRLARADKAPESAERAALGLALQRLRQRKGMTQQQAADALGVNVVTWQRYEWGWRGINFEHLPNVAAAIGATREEVIEEARAGQPVSAKVVRLPVISGRGLPVRDRVQAGAWLLADDLDQDAPVYLPAMADPRYPHADQWLSEVSGDSVDQLRIFNGDLVQCVDVVAIGYHPKTGDIVEVERSRFEGQERELTIKQVEVLPDGRVQLWPRSNNPRWKDPIELTPEDGRGDHVEVRIRGLVLTTIRRLS